MSDDILQVIIDLQAQQFSGTVYPVVMVTLPEHLWSTLEILSLDPQNMIILPDESTGELQLHINGLRAASIDNRNGNLERFQRLLEESHLFALTMTSCDTGSKDGELYILTRTAMADNRTGRVVSDTGPCKMSYQEACAEDAAAPESYVTERSFRDAVAIAVAIKDDDVEDGSRKAPSLSLVN